MSRYAYLALILGWLFAPVADAADEAAAGPAPQIAISPPRFFIELDNGRATESLQIMNLSDDKTQEIAVSVANWDLDENNQVLKTEAFLFAVPPGGLPPETAASASEKQAEAPPAAPAPEEAPSRSSEPATAPEPPAGAMQY